LIAPPELGGTTGLKVADVVAELFSSYFYCYVECDRFYWKVEFIAVAFDIGSTAY
jgi:hypothetical protein